MPDIHLVHLLADNEFAILLAGDLQAAKINILRDAIDGGDHSDDLFQRLVSQSSFVVLVCSPATSGLVEHFLNTLPDTPKSGVLAYSRPCKIPPDLPGLKKIDFSSDYPTALMDLMSLLYQVQPDFERKRPLNRFPFRMILGGALFGAVSNYVLYVFRLHGESLIQNVIVGFIFSLLGWSLVATVAWKLGNRLKLALIGGGVAVILWVIMFGAYLDVVAAALLFGAPIGACVGLLLAHLWKIFKERISR